MSSLACASTEMAQHAAEQANEGYRMKWTHFIIAVGLLSTSGAAQDKADGISPSSTTVLVNGQVIRGRVLEIDGKHYVALEDLAQSLHGAIGYGEGQISLTLPPKNSAVSTPPVSAVAAPSNTAQTASLPAPDDLQKTVPQPSSQVDLVHNGRIKGTLTYFFDFHVGNKPDDGSKVWLVRGRADIPADQALVASATSVGTSTNPQEYAAVQFSAADANGNFDFPDVPPGEYTVIAQSAHTKGSLKNKGNLFAKGNGHTLRDSNGRLVFLNLQVKAGEAVDASRDFGPDLDR